jgi:putative FmdB family regulatory protein
MPIYEYVCTACARRVEVIHGIAASGPSTCETCGGALRKAISPPAIHFKGSGWAKVDARSAASKTSTKAADPGTPEAGTGAGTTAPSAPADGGSKPAPAPAGSTGSAATD